ncbi:hypothetical protein [Jiangella alkaliphila]|uniref:hypothetical protein n=1 Tax=Jiangella alkaliphila TaxID=419479 RepID=UPI00128AF675|nr:hypothetical protein [Jiangella alkaliphila]
MRAFVETTPRHRLLVRVLDVGLSGEDREIAVVDSRDALVRAIGQWLDALVTMTDGRSDAPCRFDDGDR